jgi:hypothetical protein
VTGAATVRSQAPSPAAGQALLRDVRYSTSACPRVVFEFENHAPSYAVGYAKPPFANCGSGERVDNSSWGASAYLVVHSNAASGVDLSGPTFRQTYTKSTDIAVSSGILRRIHETCDFEGVLEWVVALGERHAFRASTLTSPARLVIDFSQGPA